MLILIFLIISIYFIFLNLGRKEYDNKVSGLKGNEALAEHIFKLYKLALTFTAIVACVVISLVWLKEPICQIFYYWGDLIMILPILFFLAFFQIFIEIGRRYYEKALESKEEDALYKLIFKLYQLIIYIIMFISAGILFLLLLS